MTNPAPSVSLQVPDLDGWNAYTPVMVGTTDNPVATMTTQLGLFMIMNNAVFLNVKIVSTTMTKTTLTDIFQVTTPLPAATVAGMAMQGAGRVENATAVANAMMTEIASAGTVITFRNYVLATASAQTTYQVANPGIGVLTNTITVNATIIYPII